MFTMSDACKAVRIERVDFLGKRSFLEHPSAEGEQGDVRLAQVALCAVAVRFAVHSRIQFWRLPERYTVLSAPADIQVMAMTTWVPAILSVYWTVVISALLWAVLTDPPS
jgi:hypothetical protein